LSAAKPIISLQTRLGLMMGFAALNPSYKLSFSNSHSLNIR
jgi:hypothetical protein